MTTQLLATVISPSEALSVVDIADIIDVKDPVKGPLGAPEPSTVAKIVRATGSSRPVSAALGDADFDIGRPMSLALAMSDAGADIVKLAVSNISYDLAVSSLSIIRNSLCAHVKVIAVAYADAKEGFATASQLPAIASFSGVDGILIDTFSKNGETLFDILTENELSMIIGEAEKLGLTTAIAGSLNAGHLDAAIRLSPDFIGFRSAITVNGDRGAVGIDIEKAEEIKELLLSHSATIRDQRLQSA